jgi:hypothetical protein
MRGTISGVLQFLEFGRDMIREEFFELIRELNVGCKCHRWCFRGTCRVPDFGMFQNTNFVLDCLYEFQRSALGELALLIIDVEVLNVPKKGCVGGEL